MRRIRFWGTRGSLPVALPAAALRRKLVLALDAAADRTLGSREAIEKFVDVLPFAISGTYGGNTSCVEIETGTNEYVLCDLGSGARTFAQAAMTRQGPAAPQTFHIFMSHMHWDHIMGLPFFTPAYVPGNRIFIYGSHQGLEAALRRQQDPPSFPVDFNALRADIAFVHLDPGTPTPVAGMTVTTKLQRHTGDSYGYRFESNGRTVVYSTDSEHPLAHPEQTDGFVAFFKNADVVIFDAMYSLADAISIRADWGHSSNIVGVELCQMAGVRHLCLFHHEPAFDDNAIERVLADTRRLEEITRGDVPLLVSAAYDGMEIDL